MEVFRLTRKKYSGSLSGKGSAIRGARWNSIGTELIYTASNRSLAMAEVAVHFTLATIPDDYIMTTIFAPDNLSLKVIQEKELPEDWNSFPYISSTKHFGDDFVKDNNFCLLKIPSAVTKGDFNVLINPKHSEFKMIKIISQEPFPFDYRIFK